MNRVVVEKHGPVVDPIVCGDSPHTKPGMAMTLGQGKRQG